MVGLNSRKDSTDINKILVKARAGQAISHLNKYQGVYGDFTDMPDLLEANRRLEQGNKIFDDLPGEIKREFNQSPAEFFQFVNDPANANRLKEVLPDLAKVGDQRPNVVRTAANMAATGSEALVAPSSNATPDGGSGNVSEPSDGDTGGVPS